MSESNSDGDRGAKVQGRGRGRVGSEHASRPARIVSVFGTRPEMVKMARVIRAMTERPGLQPINVLTSQHTDLIQPFIDLFQVEIHHDLDVMRPGQRPAEVTARIMERLDPLLESIEPDLVLVQGDTASTFAGAMAAFYRSIPVGHIEAGLRTDDPMNPYPEEMHRRLVTRMAGIHFAATEHNVRLLEAEGVPAEDIRLTGNPGIDALHHTLEHTKPSAAVEQIHEATAGTKCIVLTAHRRESHGELMAANLRALRAFVEEYADVSLVFPVHPNPNVRKPAAEILGGVSRIHLTDPLGHSDFLHLLQKAWLVVSDSGGIQEEVPSLGKVLFVLRENTERPEVLESGFGELVGGDPEKLGRRLREIHADDRWIRSVVGVANPFGDGKSGPAIAAAVEEFVR